MQRQNIVKQIKLNYQEAIRLNPNNPFFYLRLGICYEREENLTEAFNYYQRSLEIDSKYLPTLQRLVNFFETQEDYQQAVFYLQQIIDLQPENLTHYFRLAQFFAILSNGKGILDTYQFAINKYPHQPQLYFWLADFYWQISEDKKAMAVYNQALDNNIDYPLELATIYQKMGEIAWKKFANTTQENEYYKQAIDIYKDLLENDIRSEILSKLINIYDQKNEFLQAIYYGQLLVKIQPYQPGSYMKLARIMMNQGLFKKTANIYEKCFNLELNLSLNIYNNYAICLGVIGDIIGEIKVYQDLIDKSPSYHITSLLYKKLGIAFQKNQQFNQANIYFARAKNIYKQMLNLEPLAVSEMKILKEEIAEIDSISLSFYRWQIRQDRLNINWQLKLAKQALEKQLWDEATAIYYDILQLDSQYNSLEFYLNLITALIEQRRYEEATEIVNQAITLYPKQTDLQAKKQFLINPYANQHHQLVNASQDLVICIITCAKNKDKQTAIRNTWLQEVIKCNIPYFFVIGQPNNSSYLDGDILYVNADDTYEELPRKIYEVIKYIHDFTKYNYLFKVNDDCYVSIKNLLQCNFISKDYIGLVMTNLGNNRESHIDKTTNPNIGKYTGDFTGTFAGGGYGYFLSRYSMKKIVNHSDINYLKSELYEDKLVSNILRSYHIYPDCLENYITGGEFVNKSTDYQLALSPGKEIPYPHHTNNVVVFHTDAAPQRLEEIYQNYYNDDYQNKIFLRNFDWWKKANNKVCLERIDKKIIDIKFDDILCIVIVRNESLRLPYLLKFYRQRGVNKFLIVDNNSTDDTQKYLLEQADVYLWHTARPFNTGKLHWIELLLKTYGVNHWCLTIDADEFIYYADCETKDLHQLCAELEQENKQAMTGVLLDMYSDLPINHTIYTPGQNPLAVCPYFDKQFYTYSKLANNGQICYFGGVRERIFAHKGNYLHKVPLIKYDYSAQLVLGQHLVYNLQFSQQTCCLLHFKYFDNLLEISLRESQRKQYSCDAVQYKTYLNKLCQDQAVCMFSPEHSVKYENSQQLVELGIIQYEPRKLFQLNQDNHFDSLKDSQCLFIILCLTVIFGIA